MLNKAIEIATRAHAGQVDPHPGRIVILLTLSGSHSYGTNIAGSGIDVRGIY